MNLKDKNLALFMTTGMSLSKWDKAGILSREIAPYNLLAQEFKQIFIFTYGRQSDLDYQSQLAPNIKIIYRRWLPTRFYKFLAPLLHFSIIKQSHFLKTNQMRGVEMALLAKKINPSAKLIIRTGYTQSLFDAQAGIDTTPIKKLETKAYQFSDLSLVTSQADKDYLLKTYSLPETKIKVIANYINTDTFKPIPKTKYNNRLLFIGRLHKQKNLPTLIEALANTNLILDIIGNSKTEDDLTTIAQVNKVTVNFLGSIPNHNLPDTINKYSIFILPSLYEGMPKTLLEAMACGLACIATDVTGSKEVITHNQNGLLAQTDSASLKANILKLSTDKNLQAKLGTNARQFILDNFSLSTQIKIEVNLYKNLI